MAQTGRPARQGALETLVRLGCRAPLPTPVQPAAPDRLAARVPRGLLEAQVQPVNMDRPAILGRGATLELESPDRPVALVQRVALGRQEDLVIPGRPARQVISDQLGTLVRLGALDPGATSELESPGRPASLAEQVKPAPLDQPALGG
jgi:hypothetical protein